jgi:integrase
MRGSIQRRGRNSWRIRFDVPAAAAGRRKQQSVTVRGTKRQAEAELRKRLGAVDDGSYVELAKGIVADLVRSRVARWFEAGDISLRTRERYDLLVDHQILPHLGSIVLQKLRTLHIEEWHAKLRAAGRADGTGGLAPGTIRAAHQVLNKALRDAVKHGLVARNVCSSENGEGAPPANQAELAVITADEIGAVVAKLRGRPLYHKVVISLFMGLRRGEVLALRWGRVDFAAKILKVHDAVEETRGEGLRIKRPETAAGVRDLVMPDIVIDALQELRRETIERHLAMGLGRPTDETFVFPKIFDGSCQSPNATAATGAPPCWPCGCPTFHCTR